MARPRGEGAGSVPPPIRGIVGVRRPAVPPSPVVPPWCAVLSEAEPPTRPSLPVLSGFLRHTPMLAWTTDAEGVFHYGNPAFHHFVGEGREVEGRTLESLFPAAYARVYRENNATVLSTGMPLHTTESSVGGDGRRRTYAVVKFPIDADGGPALVGGMAMELTERLSTQAALEQESTRYHRLISWLGQRFFVYSYRPSDNVPVFVGGDPVGMFGVPREEALRRPFPELIDYHPDDIGPVFDAQRRMLAGDVSDVEGTARILHPTRGWRTLRYHSHAVRDPSGEIVAVDGVLEDVTAEVALEVEREAARRALSARVDDLRRRTSQLALLREMSDLLQVCRSVREGFTMLPGALVPLFPGFSGALYAVDERSGRCRRAATWGALAPTREAFEVSSCWALRRGRATTPPGLVTGTGCAHDGLPPGVGQAFCMPILAQRAVVGLLVLSSATSDEIAAELQDVARSAAEQIGLGLANLQLRETLQLRASTDPLTGLANRRAIDERLPGLLADAVDSGDPVAIVMLDLDHFKRCNDTHGHEAGDHVLASVGAVVRGHVRRVDIACRFGGEELLLVLPGAGRDEAVRWAEELRTSIRGLRLRFEGVSLGPVTASMGVALLPEHGTGALQLIGAADAAMYRAKAAGRDRVAVAGPAA